jgi:hypothetical protein
MGMDTPPSKTCCKCGRSFGLSDFHRRRGTKDGLRSECKLCRSHARRKSPVTPPFHKLCPRCKEILPFTRFYMRSSYVHSWCAACEGEKKTGNRTQRAVARKAERDARVAAVLEAGEKPCKTCEVVHDLDDFYTSKSCLDGHMGSCKACTEKRRNRPDPEDEERASRWAARKASFERQLQDASSTSTETTQ